MTIRARITNATALQKEMAGGHFLWAHIVGQPTFGRTFQALPVHETENKTRKLARGREGRRSRESQYVLVANRSFLWVVGFRAAPFVV